MIVQLPILDGGVPEHSRARTSSSSTSRCSLLSRWSVLHIIPDMGPLQIVLDTNVLVSSLRSQHGASFRLISLLGTGAFQINLSVPLVLEYEEVLRRQKRSLRLTQTAISDLLDYLCAVANLHAIHFLWRPTLPDPGDDLLLDLAANADCQYIVTYNKRHFKGVETFGVESVTAKELLVIIGALS